MKIDKYIEENQPVLSQILKNVSQNNSFAHAYLISGSFGLPVSDIAKYIAKNIFCENRNPLCCNECENCRKIEEDNFLPLVIIDGSIETIKKEQIQNLEELFSATTQEKSQKRAYIINQVENMTAESVNALLKFLEEPNDNIYAILTTQNILKVLPTIISRCQVVSLSPSNKPLLIKNSIELGVDSSDAELLSFIYSIPEDVVTASEDENYKITKNLLINYLNSLVNPKESSRFNLEINVLPTLKNKFNANLFLDLLVFFLNDALKLKIGQNNILKSYDKLLEEIYNKIANIEDVIFNIYQKKSEINLNINTNLLFIEIDRLLNKGN